MYDKKRSHNIDPINLRLHSLPNIFIKSSTPKEINPKESKATTYRNNEAQLDNLSPQCLSPRFGERNNQIKSLFHNTKEDPSRNIGISDLAKIDNDTRHKTCEDDSSCIQNGVRKNSLYRDKMTLNSTKNPPKISDQSNEIYQQDLISKHRNTQGNMRKLSANDNIVSPIRKNSIKNLSELEKQNQQVQNAGTINKSTKPIQNTEDYSLKNEYKDNSMQLSIKKHKTTKSGLNMLDKSPKMSNSTSHVCLPMAITPSMQLNKISAQEKPLLSTFTSNMYSKPPLSSSCADSTVQSDRFSTENKSAKLTKRDDSGNIESNIQTKNSQGRSSHSRVKTQLITDHFSPLSSANRMVDPSQIRFRKDSSIVTQKKEETPLRGSNDFKCNQGIHKDMSPRKLKFSLAGDLDSPLKRLEEFQHVQNNPKIAKNGIADNIMNYTRKEHSKGVSMETLQTLVISTQCDTQLFDKIKSLQLCQSETTRDLEVAETSPVQEKRNSKCIDESMYSSFQKKFNFKQSKNLFGSYKKKSSLQYYPSGLIEIQGVSKDHSDNFLSNINCIIKDEIQNRAISVRKSSNLSDQNSSRSTLKSNCVEEKGLENVVVKKIPSQDLNRELGYPTQIKLLHDDLKKSPSMSRIRLLDTFSYKHGLLTITFEPSMELEKATVEDSEESHDTKRPNSHHDNLEGDSIEESIGVATLLGQDDQIIPQGSRSCNRENCLRESIASSYINASLLQENKSLQAEEKGLEDINYLKILFDSCNAVSLFEMFLKSLIRHCLIQRNLSGMNEFNFTQDNRPSNHNTIKLFKERFLPIRFLSQRTNQNQNFEDVENFEGMMTQNFILDVASNSSTIQESSYPNIQNCTLKLVSGEILSLTKLRATIKSSIISPAIMFNMDAESIRKLMLKDNKFGKMPIKTGNNHKDMKNVLDELGNRNWNTVIDLLFKTYYDKLSGVFEYVCLLEGEFSKPNVKRKKEMIAILSLPQNQVEESPVAKRNHLTVSESPSCYHSRRLQRRLKTMAPVITKSGDDGGDDGSLNNLDSKPISSNKHRTMINCVVGAKEEDNSNDQVFLRATQAQTLQRLSETKPPDHKSEQNCFEATRATLRSEHPEIFNSGLHSNNSPYTIESASDRRSYLGNTKTATSGDVFETTSQLPAYQTLKIESLDKLSTITSRRYEDQKLTIAQANSPQGIMSHNSLSPLTCLLSSKNLDDINQASSFREVIAQFNVQSPRKRRTAIICNEHQYFSRNDNKSKTWQDVSFQRPLSEEVLKTASNKDKVKERMPSRIFLSKNISESRILKRRTEIVLSGSLRDKVINSISFNKLYELQQLLYQYPLIVYEIKDHEENNLLMLASKCGFKEVLAEFFNRGIDINTRNIYGETALHLALSYRHYDIADILLKNGAKQNIYNNKDQTPCTGEVISTYERNETQDNKI